MSHIKTGTVKNWPKDKAFGFILLEEPVDGIEQAFVHRSDIQGGHTSVLLPGQRVEFAVVKTQKGLKAIGVRVLN